MDGVASLPAPVAAAVRLDWDQFRRALPEDRMAEWLACCRSLADAAGAGLAADYVRALPACLAAAGPEAAFALAEALAGLARQAPGQAAAALCTAAPAAARRVGDRFPDWLRFLRHVAELAPDSLPALLGGTERVLGALDLIGYQDWVFAGLRHAGADLARRERFFRLQDPAAIAALESGGPGLVFSHVERRLKAYLAALWGAAPPIAPVPATGGDAPRRVSLSGGIIRVPDSFRGVPPEQAALLFRAALTHATAHLRFTPRQFPVGSLKPVQVALVSLIEDARVEQLAIRALPGLRRVWLPFHVAVPGGAVTANGLMARLARALLDPEYRDDDPWVAKGAGLFLGARESWGDPGISRSIGGLLGNDLGQMRVQFNARTYVVEPAYRDDNLGLWDFGAGGTGEEREEAAALRLELLEEPARGEPDSPEAADDDAMRVRVTPADEETGIPVATYPEWDYAIARERADWTTVVQFPAPSGRARDIDDILERHAAVVERITRLIESAKVSRPVRLRRQAEGDLLDLDAAIRAMLSLRIGEAPDPRVYGRSERRHRDLATLALLDVSQSTNDKVRGTGKTVLMLEREAVALLSFAVAGLGDRFALRAFCSNGRGEVRYQPIKEFGEAFGEMPKRRLAGLRGGLSTRLGAAIRHAGAELEGQRSYRRLLLLVSDGEPSDVDVADRRYLVEDARHAVLELEHKGIDVFCVGLESGIETYLPRIFGPHNFIMVDRVERLPERLPMLYLRLTA